MARPVRMMMCVALTALTLAGCRKPATWSDPARHRSAFVTANGVRLHYLDWGGKGPALILIHGYGDNAHVFDDFAPAFTDQFRVIAYDRRGHGESEASAPYDMATLTEDLRVLMDSLGIARASLAGWSMGGNEITAMAGVHPERVTRLVYLEGGYDWADSKLHFDLSVPDSTLKSLDAWRTFQRTQFFAGVSDQSRYEAYVRALVDVQPDGTLRPRTGDSAAQAFAVVLGSAHRDYTKVHVPALAIYARTMVDVSHGDSAQRARNVQWEQRRMAQFRVASVERIRRELRGVEVVRVPGTHMDFLFTSRDQVVAAMRRFLGASVRKKN